MKVFFFMSVIILILQISVILPLNAQNQFPSQMWYKGNIYGTDGQTHEGLVKYDLGNNFVQLKTETISTFTAYNVSQFEIQNTSNNGLRRFYSMPFSQNGNNATPVFFEVLTEGNDITLLCREYIETYFKWTGSRGTGGGPTFDGPQTKRTYRLAFEYYFLKNGSIEKYSLNKKDLFVILPGYKNEISLFMKKNRLEHDKRSDLIRITTYYNELQN